MISSTPSCHSVPAPALAGRRGLKQRTEVRLPSGDLFEVKR